MLRDCVKNKIYNALNYDIFRYEDFIIEEDVGFVGDIRIRYNEYYCKMQFDDDCCQITFSPGKVLTEETVELNLSIFENRIEKYIYSWLPRIKRDMINPVEKRFVDSSIQEFRSEIENKLSEIDDGYFTKEEGELLRERLEQLENIISERDSQEELQSEVAKMKEEIEFLKATVDTLSKKKWFRNALIKIWTWGQKDENRKLIETSVETIKSISQMDIKL